jgi:hypothetical protein
MERKLRPTINRIAVAVRFVNKGKAIKFIVLTAMLTCVAPTDTAVMAAPLVSTALAAPSTAQKPEYGVLFADPSLASQDHTAGIRLAIVSLDWAQWEPAAAVFSASYQAAELGVVNQFRRLGDTVGINLALNNAPAWALAEPDSQLEDQYGRTSGTLNFEFSSAIQSLAATYVTSVVKALGLVQYYNLGASYTTETIYPTTETNQWWAFGPIAQGQQTGLPAGVGPNPMPGWIPGTTTWRSKPVTRSQVQGWYNWYIGALASFISSEKALIERDGYGGYFQLNWPGDGVNPWVYNYRISNHLVATSHDSYDSMNAGAVYQVLLQDLPDLSRTVVNITSVGDGSGTPANNACQASDTAVDYATNSTIDSWSSTRWLSYLAKLHGMPVMGESTGNNTAAQMSTDFVLTKDCGLIGLQWAFDYQLYGGKYATLADYSALINATSPSGGSPVVTALAVTEGGLGSSVMIRGAQFTGTTQVRFGSTPATSFTVINDSNIDAEAPGVFGTQNITVSNPVGTSATNNGDIYIGYSRPGVSGVSPSSGPPSGGTTVTLMGVNFSGVSEVLFGGSPARSLTVLSSTRLVAVSPSGRSWHNVSVVNPAGTSPVVPSDVFTWFVRPTVVRVRPSSGPQGGGTTVVVSGSGFTGATGVRFGSTPAASFKFINDGVIDAISPAGAGARDVTVIGPEGTSSTSAADRFTGY